MQAVEKVTVNEDRILKPEWRILRDTGVVLQFKRQNGKLESVCAYRATNYSLIKAYTSEQWLSLFKDFFTESEALHADMCISAFKSFKKISDRDFDNIVSYGLYMLIDDMSKAE